MRRKLGLPPKWLGVLGGLALQLAPTAPQAQRQPLAFAPEIPQLHHTAWAPAPAEVETLALLPGYTPTVEPPARTRLALQLPQGPATLGGLFAGPDSARLVLHNASRYPLRLNHADPAIAAGNQLHSMNHADWVLQPGQEVLLLYLRQQQGWQITAGATRPHRWNSLLPDSTYRLLATAETRLDRAEPQQAPPLAPRAFPGAAPPAAPAAPALLALGAPPSLPLLQPAQPDARSQPQLAELRPAPRPGPPPANPPTRQPAFTANPGPFVVRPSPPADSLARSPYPAPGPKPALVALGTRSAVPPPEQLRLSQLSPLPPTWRALLQAPPPPLPNPERRPPQWNPPAGLVSPPPRQD